ncbi:hypothetical protein GCM10025734_38090 [Kitasatospora paranensis]
MIAVARSGSCHGVCNAGRARSDGQIEVHTLVGALTNRIRRAILDSRASLRYESDRPWMHIRQRRWEPTQ